MLQVIIAVLIALAPAAPVAAPVDTQPVLAGLSAPELESDAAETLTELALSLQSDSTFTYVPEHAASYTTEPQDVPADCFVLESAHTGLFHVFHVTAARNA